MGAADELGWALKTAFERDGGDARAPWWFFKADTITFVLLDNLVKFLGGIDVHQSGQPVVLGKQLRTAKPPSGHLFLSGGAGFAVNRAAAKVIIKRWGAVCQPLFARDRFLATAADVGFAQCHIALGITPALSRTSAGEERFHAFPPVRLISHNFDDWFIRYSANAGEPFLLAQSTLSCCAPDSVSFHYVESDSAVFLENLLRDQDRRSLSSPSQVKAQWPVDTGGYDQRPANLQQVKLFLRLLEKITSGTVGTGWSRNGSLAGED